MFQCGFQDKFRKKCHKSNKKKQWEKLPKKLGCTRCYTQNENTQTFVQYLCAYICNPEIEDFMKTMVPPSPKSVVVFYRLLPNSFAPAYHPNWSFLLKSTRSSPNCSLSRSSPPQYTHLLQSQPNLVWHIFLGGGDITV